MGMGGNGMPKVIPAHLYIGPVDANAWCCPELGLSLNGVKA